ncbi:polymeric immunoglobulin receptor-like isoform X2 [Leuresthes tenuis]|uniref:polymeric immunoglobulin receptor-like isoform X2 n=1 Tax=Leuresthes tenuis TaxID=355514 RepID=UPI003B50C3C6
MWSLQKLLLILYPALSCVTSAAGVIHVFGYEGRDVQVSCSYDQGYEDYEKYLCKNDCGDSDVLITTSERNKTKYSIYDDKRTRICTTTISDLHSKDVGKYWCGVTRTGKDIYTEVKLETRKDSCCADVIKLQGYEEGSVSISCPYESQYTNNLKYICRGNQPSTCLQQAVITSDNIQKRRFRLTDDKMSRFTVKITSLTLEDSGLYLCGVHRNTGLDVFSAVLLEVREWCCVKSETMSGIVGRPVTLQCPYPPQHQKNRKFLCKGDQRNNCRDMTSQSRFTLHNVSSNSFSVTIAELEAGDAGTYWCGSDSQWSFGNYTKIHLSEVYQQQTSTVETAGLTNSSHVPSKPITGTDDTGNGSELKAVDTQIYENNDAVVMHSKRNTSKLQSVCYQYDNDYEDQPDYENFTADGEIYCNQVYNNIDRI